MTVQILQGDCRDVLATLPADSVHCCVTSPPYFGLRDYGVAGQIGLEPTPDAFVAEMVAVFREVRRVLRPDASLWLNLGDSYAGSRAGPQGATGQMFDRSVAARRCRERSKDTSGAKHKDLLMIPARVALALQADGWYLRSDIIWHKPNPMPESVTDRPTSAHEHVFLLTKSARYFYDADAIREPQDTLGERHEGKSGYREGHPSKGGITERALHPLGRNLRNVWTIATQPYSGAHFATFPPALIEPCIKAGYPAGGTVLDPFGGAGTTALVADRLGRNAILIELNPEYAAMARKRVTDDAPLLVGVA